MDSPGVSHPMFAWSWLSQLRCPVPAEPPPVYSESLYRWPRPFCFFMVFLVVLGELRQPPRSEPSTRGRSCCTQHSSRYYPHSERLNRSVSALKNGDFMPFQLTERNNWETKMYSTAFLKCNYVNCSNWTKGGGRWFCRQTLPPDLVSTGDVDQKAEFISLSPITTSLHKLVRNPLPEKSKLFRLVRISFLAIHFPLHADFLSSLHWHSCVKFTQFTLLPTT